MRNAILAFVVALSISSFGCAGVQSGASASSIINQLPGVVQSINTLAQSSPLDASAKEQLNGYVAWAEFIAKAAGVIVGAVNPTGL